ncbi:hypothetical protein G4W71_18670 [Clostridium botulinum]|uniref:DUF7210 family protein n=1 Tax=Clostridium botulinum TaxID=1491 RepID=UPI001788CC56|nr:hypothetical protein [Clostridium botulinum]MBE1306030.1 hypothetical protein [Clostridium botulinum]
MSIKALENITHNGVLYKNGDEITEITKDEAIRLVDLQVAELINDKFKEPKKAIKEKISSQKRNRKNEEEEYLNA